LPNLKRCEDTVRRIMEKNKWSQTPNVTLLESAKKILKATDKWRRNHSTEEVMEEILESVFFLLSTCAKLDSDIDIDKLFDRVCKSKENFSFDGIPDDLVWSFILFETEPHVDYRTPHQHSQ